MGCRLCAGLALLSLAAAQSLPKIDFGALGTIAIAGNFAGLQLYDSSNNNTLSPSGSDSSLLSRSATGQVRILGSTDNGGSIDAICQSSSNQTFLAGNFTSIANVSASNVASYNPSTNTFAALGSGLDGAVQVLFCDDASNTLYAGGNFTDSLSTWAYSGSSAWTVPSLPISSLNGPVQAIQAAGQDASRSIFLGGQFSYSITNSSTGSRDSTEAPSFPSLGSSLTPIPLNTPESYTWAGPTASGSADPTDVFCPTGDGSTGTTWLAEEGERAIFVVRLYTPHQMGGIRIGNVFGGQGTRQFNVLTVPDSIVQPLQYYSDPNDPTSELRTCQWECPLSHNTSIPYQDFLFPNDTTATGFQININQWYGSGGGLHQVSLLSNGAYAFASEGANQGACTTGIAAQDSSSSSTSGTWSNITVSSSISGVSASALEATVPTSTAATDSPTLSFSPAISSQGQYEAYLLVPGCSATGTCASRTTVDVIVNPGPGQGSSTTTTIDQTNTANASPLVYSGPLTAGATFEVRLSANPEGSGSGGNYQIVATKLQLVAQATDGRALATRSSAYSMLEYVPTGSNGVFRDGAFFCCCRFRLYDHFFGKRDSF